MKSAWTKNPCRLCLHENSMNSIPNDPLYLHAIFDASGVKVSPYDALPQHLCKACLLFIHQSKVFRKKCQETQKSLLDRIYTKKFPLDIKNESIIIKNQFIQPFIEPKIEKIIIEEVYNKEVFHDESEALNKFENVDMNNDILNTESKKLFQDIKDLNLNKKKIHQDYEYINLRNKDLILNNENLNQDHADLNLNYEHLNLYNKDLKEGSKTKTDSKKASTIKKIPVKAKNINKTAKCNVCEKEMLASSMQNHLKRHNLKKGPKMKNKQLLAECDICGKRMPKKHLLAHFLIHDGTSGHLICKHCEKPFYRPFALLRHCRAKHGYEKVDKCSYCNFMGCTEYEVRVHEKLHTGDPYACDVCGKTFTWKTALLQHIAEHGDPNILCSECPEIFRSNRQLIRHISQKHKRPSNIIQHFKCPYCSHTALHKITIVTHMKKIHTETNHQAIIKIYKNQTVDSSHINEKYKKHVYKTQNKFNLLNTNEINTDSETLKEDSVNFLCAFHKHLDADNRQARNADFDKNNVKFEVLSSAVAVANAVPNAVNKALNLQSTDLNIVTYLNTEGQDLNADLTWQVKNKKQVTDLNKSDVKLSNADDKALNLQINDLNIDTYLNTVGQDLKADFTDDKEDLTKDGAKLKMETDVDANYLDLHEDTKTDKDSSPVREKVVDENTIKCKVCKIILLKQNYSRHKKGHVPNDQPPPSRKRPYVKCEVCETMVQEHNLKEHLAIHQGTGKKIHCEHCDKIFSRQSRLLRHCKASHGYEKTDKCSYCDYRGCTRAEVTIHERKHTGEKPYVCSICDATFRFPSYRLSHLAEKHGQGNMVQCEVCAETFLTARLLSSHKYDKHPKHTYSYECALCHNVYKRRGAARKHLLKNHNESRTIDKIIKVKLSSNPALVS